jgi:hypothetical protein
MKEWILKRLGLPSGAIAFSTKIDITNKAIALLWKDRTYNRENQVYLLDAQES